MKAWVCFACRFTRAMLFSLEQLFEKEFCFSVAVPPKKNLKFDSMLTNDEIATTAFFMSSSLAINIVC